MTNRDDDYDVGYGKPPKATQFRKGTSGNRNGRPKGSRNFASDVDEILATTMTISEQGHRRKISTQLAALMRLREKALKGDARALERLLAMADQRSLEKEAQSKERTLSAEEGDILQRYIDDFGTQTGGEGRDDGE